MAGKRSAPGGRGEIETKHVTLTVGRLRRDVGVLEELAMQ